MTRLVLLGGGHAHAIVLHALRQFVSKNLDVVLVSEGTQHTYSAMVPGVIAGHYVPEQAQIDLQALARGAGAAFHQGRVEQIAPGSKQVVLAGGVLLRYDVLSLNLGSVPAAVPRGATAVKPFDTLLARWREVTEHGPAAPRIAVTGAGAGGMELGMAMKYALDRRGRGGAVELFSDQLNFTPAVDTRLRRALDRLGIPLNIGQSVPEGFDATFWATGVSALPLLRESGLRTDEHGFVRVGPQLCSESHREVFAAGDCASFMGGALPKSASHAVRQGTVLAENLKRAVRGMGLLDYEPQAEALLLVSCGAKYEIASRGGWSAEGKWLWRWKDWLDRRWTGRFRRM